MIDPYRIDSHKLHLHPRRVADWLEGKNIAPIYAEVSPSGACNHRCRFCALDFMRYKPRFLPTDIFSDRLQEMGKMGVKAVMFAGEGEPLLHKNIGQLARAARAAGIDIAFTTNGVLLTPELSRQLLPLTSWIKVSFNAGSPQTYARIHGTQALDFERVLQNIADAVRIRRESSASCTLGFQILLLPENKHEVVDLARAVRDIDADYLVVKSYSQHPQSITREYSEITYEDCLALSDDLKSINTESFRTIFRMNTIQRWDMRKKSAPKCCALPFWTYIDAGCNVWGCSMFLENEHFNYGNLLTENFSEIWNGNLRKKSMLWYSQHLDAENCRFNCRMENINSYLWELKHPNQHVNFI